MGFGFSFLWQEYYDSKIPGTWLCVYVSITVLLWQNVHGALSANIYLFKLWIVTLEKCEICSRLTLLKMAIFGAAHRWGAKKALTLLHLSHISYNDVDWYIYTLPKEDQKNTKITWHTPWFLLTSAFFHQKSGNFVISTNTDKDCILAQNLSLFLNSLESWQIFLINLVIILMMSAKMLPQAFLKWRYFEIMIMAS